MKLKPYNFARIASALVAVFMATNMSFAQEKLNDKEVADQLATQANEVTDEVKDRFNEIGKTLDQSETAEELRAGILNTIYQGAEYVGKYSAFYWCAFALMVAGVVSFTLQTVLTKFFLLFKMHINIKEMMGDLLGLAISAVGLILATQAATENSSFTQSPSAVISATAVGAMVGFVFYIWGQRQEFQAAEGASAPKTKES